MFSLLAGISPEQKIIITSLCASILLLTLLNGILLILVRRKHKKVNKMLDVEAKKQEEFDSVSPQSSENHENFNNEGDAHNI